ncbi:MAG: hypothetical protein ACRDVP_11740 [Acidimicrobiales bacterium]
MRAQRFSYGGFELAAQGLLSCRYRLDDQEFIERFDLPPGDWSSPHAQRAARLVYLLAGVSYYKAGAPRLVVADVSLRPAERHLLEDFYIRGLGEFAYRNGFDLSDLELRDNEEKDDETAIAPPPRCGPLVPFGGGIDSIVTAEMVRACREGTSLLVVSPPGAPYAAIDRAAQATGLPVVSVGRRLDPVLLEAGSYLTGHVPVTGILTALATLVAVGTGRCAVVMSNEWSASSGNLVIGSEVVNHQYSKSRDFEVAFSKAKTESLGDDPAVFSGLRPFSELLIARRFASLTMYHDVFHSCNRAFAIDAGSRLDAWCARCDKCCFIDLVLAPFLSVQRLRSIFVGTEPLENPDLFESFATLVGMSENPKPFECVGDVQECAVAASMAAQRDDRADNQNLARLAGVLPEPDDSLVEMLFEPRLPHDVPDDLLAAAALV